MAEPKKTTKAKLLMGIMYADEEICKRALSKLPARFGEFEQGPTINFDFTDYYEQETGKNLKKTYVTFKQMINREELPKIKLFTNKLEQEFLQDKNRNINIDPGYVTEHQVVLASAKKHPHRIYLADGIYGQLVLVFCRNEWMPVEKTFPDYKTKEVQQFLKNVRN